MPICITREMRFTFFYNAYMQQWLGHDELTVWLVNTLRPKQNGRHFADDIFKYIFLNENVWILIKISLNFVPKGSINNIPSLVQIMAWRRPGDKPLTEPMMVSLSTHICVTRPQWVNIWSQCDHTLDWHRLCERYLEIKTKIQFIIQSKNISWQKS